MEEFVLIMRHEDGSKLASPEQMQVWMKQTMDWIGGIAAQNKFVAGTGLPFEDARVVRPNNVVTNGPFGEIKETIGGFMTVKAESVEEAVAFAK
ncbi:MAG TPA: YciI family protein, partial [Cyclobacteriaceae bacterium]|nr:YciI family protein [Cyclobacteriaceae bacterium]